jgi:small-conductance mechanosensitive channel
VAGAAVVYLVVRKFIIIRLERMAASTDNDLDDRLVHFFKQFFGFVVLFLIVLLVLNIHEIEVTPLLAGAGIMGVALGFAAKESLADILAGIFLITDRPMRKGNRVKIEYIGRDWGGWGDVIDIGLRRTTVRNTDGVVVNYPNNVLANSVITNFSAEEGPIRVRVRFLVGYGADLPEVMSCAEKAIQESEGVNPDSAEVVIRSMWDDKGGHVLGGILLEGRYRIDEVSRRTRIRSGVLNNLHHSLKEAAVPFPALSTKVERSGD